MCANLDYRSVCIELNRPTEKTFQQSGPENKWVTQKGRCAHIHTQPQNDFTHNHPNNPPFLQSITLFKSTQLNLTVHNDKIIHIVYFQFLTETIWIWATLLHLCVSVLPIDDDNVLHIGGIFPIAGKGGWQGGQACMPAANLALEDVNRRKDMLPGFTLRLHSNDSEVTNKYIS